VTRKAVAPPAPRSRDTCRPRVLCDQVPAEAGSRTSPRRRADGTKRGQCTPRYGHPRPGTLRGQSCARLSLSSRARQRSLVQHAGKMDCAGSMEMGVSKRIDLALKIALGKGRGPLRPVLPTPAAAPPACGNFGPADGRSSSGTGRLQKSWMSAVSVVQRISSGRRPS